MELQNPGAFESATSRAAFSTYSVPDASFKGTTTPTRTANKVPMPKHSGLPKALSGFIAKAEAAVDTIRNPIRGLIGKRSTADAGRMEQRRRASSDEQPAMLVQKQH